MKRFCLISLLLVLPLFLMAQNSFSDFPKPKIDVSVADSITVFELSEDYSVKKGGYSSLYEFSKYDALKPKRLEIDKIPSFYLRAGYQFPVMPMADVDYRKMINENLVFGFNGHYDSFSAKNDYRRNYAFGGDMKYVWQQGELSFGANYNGRGFLFTDAGGNQADHFTGDFNAYARISSANEAMNDIYYDFKCTYDNYNNSLLAFYEAEKLKLYQNNLSFKGFVGTTFDIHRIYVDIDIALASYSGQKDYSTVLVQFSPLYELNAKRFKGKLGVVFGNRFGVQESSAVRSPDGNIMSSVSTIFPNVDARFEIVRRSLWAHLSVTGGYDLNSYSDIAGFCPVVNPSSPLLVGKHPVDAKLALETMLNGRLAFNLSAQFRMDENKPYVAPVFEESDVHSILACNMDVNTFRVGLDAIWKSAAITVGGDFYYNSYSSTDFEKVTQLPAVTSQLYARYNWRQRLVFSVNCSYESAVSGLEFGAYEIPDKIDLSLEVDFALSRHFKVFAKGGNLLNRKNQYMPTYNEPGLNLGGGIAITF